MRRAACWTWPGGQHVPCEVPSTEHSTGQLGPGQRLPRSSWQGYPHSSPLVFLSKCVFTALVVSRAEGMEPPEGRWLYWRNTNHAGAGNHACGHFLHLNSASECPSEGRGWVEWSAMEPLPGRNMTHWERGRGAEDRVQV